MKLITAICISLVSVSALAAPSFTDENCIKGIVGEASGESYQCKLAIAGVIRNRESLVGVYGVTAKHNLIESKHTFDVCRQAWLESAHNNISRGCKHWGGQMDKIYFQTKLGLKPVFSIGKTDFYK